MKTILALSLVLLTSACGNQSDDRLKEVSKVQSEADQDVQKARAQELEADLAQRQLYYQALTGEFEGTVKTDGGDFSVRINLVPKVPAYKPSRVRTVEEVTSDLIDLGFKIQVVQWNPLNESTAMGCVFEEIKPNLEEGAIYAIADSCPSFFSLFPSKEDLAAIDPDHKKESRGMSASILKGGTKQVNRLVALSKPSSNPKMFKFDLTRVK